MIEDAKSRGYCNTDPKLQRIVGIDGATPDTLRVPDFAKPETTGSFILKTDNIIGRELYKWFRPRPQINYNACLGCGECAASCPAKTITMMKIDKAEKYEKNAKHARPSKVPVIFRDKCINCFCCQELCPHRAVKIKEPSQPLAYRMNGKFKMKIVTFAYAKINLFLAVMGKRPDGYHDIESVMQTVSLADTVTVEAMLDKAGDKQISLSCSLPSLECKDTNIAYRAAALFMDLFPNKKYSINIHIDKNPCRSGLPAAVPMQRRP